MPKLPRVGLTLIGMLGGTAALSLGLGFVARSRTNQPLPQPPAQMEKWQSYPTTPPVGNANRDNPPAVYRMYMSSNNTPVFVSIAKATTFNAFRSPYRYLLDPDGHIIQNQEMEVTVKNEKLPFYHLLVLQGHSAELMLVHWAQAPGESPYPDGLEDPSLITTSLLTHTPLYIIDVWSPLRADIPAAEVQATVLHFAEVISPIIKSGKLPP